MWYIYVKNKACRLPLSPHTENTDRAGSNDARYDGIMSKKGFIYLDIEILPELLDEFIIIEMG